MDSQALGKFWIRVNKRGPVQEKMEDRCWSWTGTVDQDGYGRFYCAGKTWRAHRLSFLLATGKEPEIVLHKCNNPNCVRPSHLQAGDTKENLLDILIDKIHDQRDCV